MTPANEPPISERPANEEQSVNEQVGFASRLSDPSLLRDQAYIDGGWCQANDRKRVEVVDPGTGAVVGTVPDMGAKEANRAIEAAKHALRSWRSRLPQERARVLRRWADLMIANREDLAVIMTLEQGKPLAEARGEIDYAASFLEWFGEEAKRAYGDTIPSHLAGARLVVTREPVGVTAAITPWNFPSAMITRKAGAALAAGCPMIVRPASETPFSALAAAELADRAGVPAGVLQVLTGSATAIGGALMASEAVRKISFTGSTEIGRLLIAQSADTVKKMSMELGGHAPFLVFGDADIDHAVAGAINAKFQTTGQDCLAANRILVHADIYDRFVERFTKAARALKVGHGMEPGVHQGPLIDDRAVVKCLNQVSDAQSKGARLLAGGRRHRLGGRFVEPTVLADVTRDMAIFHEETFGPVAALMRFETEDEAVRLANDTVYGLAAYIYTRDASRMWRVGEMLEYGMVGLNSSKITGAPIPFGGVKQSGLGREGSRHGLDEYTELKYFCFGGMDN